MRARPVVAYLSTASREELVERFREALSRADCACSGHVGSQEVSLHVHEAHRHTWSPWLSLELRDEDEGIMLRGRFGPQPQLWTLFVFVYASLCVVIVAGGMYGVVSYGLDGSTDGILLAAVAAALLGLACGVDLTGRRIGEAQMGLIRGFVTTVVPQAEDRAP